MHWQSGKGLCRRALPDRGDAKPGLANTGKVITFNIIRIATYYVILGIS